jgi:hypothetical protein
LEARPVAELPVRLMTSTPGELMSTTAMSHIAIVEKLDGKGVDWLEKNQRRAIPTKQVSILAANYVYDVTQYTI